MTGSGEKLMAEARELLPDAVTLRRKIHSNPELGLDLPETAATVLDSLQGIDLEIARSEKSSGFLAILRGARPGPSILLRADKVIECSPRWQTTVPGEAYGADEDTLLKIVGTIEDEHNHALLFGHNPGFFDLANELLDRPLNKLVTCGVVQMRLKVKSWSEVRPRCGELLAYLYPKLYK